MEELNPKHEPSSSSNEGKVCIKCHYKRLATDTCPDYECPHCGVIYKKAEDAIRLKEASAHVVQLTDTVTVSAADDSIASQKVMSDYANAQLVYFLYFLGYFTGFFTWTAAIYLSFRFNNASYDKNWASSHFAWQVKLFWDVLKWQIAGLGVIVLGVIVSVSHSSHSAYDGATRLFGALADPFFMKAVVVGLAIVLFSGFIQLYRLIIGFAALQRRSRIE